MPEILLCFIATMVPVMIPEHIDRIACTEQASVSVVIITSLHTAGAHGVAAQKGSLHEANRNMRL